MDPQSITRALTSIEADVSRVIVLLASSKDAAPFLMRAHDAGMTGKGYTWVGTEWVREFTWVAASMPEYLLNTGVGSTNETIVEAPMETGGEGADRRRRLSSKMTELDSIMAAAAKLPVGSDGKAAETMKRLAEEAASKANSKHIRGEGQTTAASTSASRNLAAQSTWWGLNPNVGAKAIPTGAGKVLAAMNGAVGVVPRRILQNEALAGYLDRFSPDLVDDTAYMTVSSLSPPVDTSNGATVFAPLPFPTEKDCYLMNNAPATTSGLPLDHWGPYVFDAVFSIAQITAEALSPTTINSRAADISAERVAAAKARAVVAGLNGTAVIAAGNAAAFTPLAGVKMSQLNGTYLASLMRSYSQYLRPSMLTNNVPVWMPNGDRYNITLHLVNVQGEKIVPISTWTPKVRPRNVLMGEAGSLPAGLAMTDGNWTVMSASSKIIWPGQIVGFPPPDRVVESSHAGSIALAIALVGIIISFLLGSVVHHAGITILPESGVTVLVGCVFGLLLRLGFGTAVQNVAGFNETAFMLILLPIIIFESGYSLDKRPFFSQVFSIAIFAIGEYSLQQQLLTIAVLSFLSS
jgi:Receptor family ligand binding region